MEYKKGLIFLVTKVILVINSFITSEIFKIFSTKRKLVKYYYFINTYIIYQNRAFILIKNVFFNFIIIKFFYLFLYMVSIFL